MSFVLSIKQVALSWGKFGDTDSCFFKIRDETPVSDEDLRMVAPKEIRKPRYKTFRLEAPLLQIMSLACLGQIR